MIPSSVVAWKTGCSTTAMATFCRASARVSRDRATGSATPETRARGCASLAAAGAGASLMPPRRLRPSGPCQLRTRLPAGCLTSVASQSKRVGAITAFVWSTFTLTGALVARSSHTVWR